MAYGSFPWQARIALSEGKAGLRHLCSGVLVSDRFVLTAASCLTAHPMFKYRVVTGDHRLTEHDGREDVHAVQSIHVHDLYEGGSEHDLAMVKVRAAAGGTGGYFRVGQFVMPACLPKPGSRYTKDVLCEVSSWNSKDALQAAAVPVVLRHSGGDDDGSAPGCGTRGDLCAGPAVGGHPKQEDFDCQLDRGSPLVCPTRQGVTLVGLATTEDKDSCSHSDDKDRDRNMKQKWRRYLRVSDYAEWIQERLQL